MSSTVQPAIRRPRSQDPGLRQFIEDTAQAIGLLYGLPFLRGRLVEVPALAGSGTFSITHGLQRVPSGFVVLDLRRASGATGAASVYRRIGDTLDDRTLELYSSATFESLTLWVW